MYTTDHIFPFLLIKDLINEDGDPTTPHKLATGTKPSVSHLRVLFCPCVVRKATAHVETKTLNMNHQAQKGFRGFFMGMPQHQKGYLVYVHSTRKVISSYNVLFDKKHSSALSYTSPVCSLEDIAYGVYVTAGRISIASAYGRDVYDNALECFLSTQHRMKILPF